jgi:hypothetical protein
MTDWIRTTLKMRRRTPAGAAKEIKGATPADVKAARAARKRLWVDVTGLSDIDTLRA